MNVLISKSLTTDTERHPCISQKIDAEEIK